MPKINISSIFHYLNPSLPGMLDEQLPHISPQHQQLLATLELLRIEEHMQDRPYSGIGRRPHSRICVARAFVAKSVMQIQDTKHLWHALRTDDNMRRICGWDRACDVPSESTFSRIFTRLSETNELEQLHKQLVKDEYRDHIICHVAIDSSAIDNREKPVTRVKSEAKPRRKKRGRPRRDEQAAQTQLPTRIHNQMSMGWEDAMSELPKYCSIGAKKNSKGQASFWIGRKLHALVSDEGIPICVFTTSAHVHDSQVAIPLIKKASEQVTSLYDLADAAYDAQDIKDFSVQLGHVPIIDQNHRRGKSSEIEPDRARRYQARTVVERFFSQLKDNYGGRNIRVRGDQKVHTHLMIGVLCIFAHALLHLPY